jgi:hypothetical protein
MASQGVFEVEVLGEISQRRSTDLRRLCRPWLHPAMG